jgi:hypothetical protein
MSPFCELARPVLARRLSSPSAACTLGEIRREGSYPTGPTKRSRGDGSTSTGERASISTDEGVVVTVSTEGSTSTPADMASPASV